MTEDHSGTFWLWVVWVGISFFSQKPESKWAPLYQQTPHPGTSKRDQVWNLGTEFIVETPNFISELVI